MVNIIERDGAAVLSLDRPDRGNAMNSDDVPAMRETLGAVDRATGLIVIRGAGGRAFCGGIDAHEILGMGSRKRQHAVGTFLDLVSTSGTILH